MQFDVVESRPSFSSRLLGSLIILWLVVGAVAGYAIHEHRIAQHLRSENQQTDATLAATRTQVDDLATKINAISANMSSSKAPSATPDGLHVTSSRRSEAARWKKMQSQLDAQNKAIEDTRNQLANTQGDLSNTRAELTGSIAHTHDELVLLEKKGERNYYEFDLNKTKQFQHDGPLGVRLRKANPKHQYADLELLVDDREVSQKHVNLYQPLTFYTPDNPQPFEVVINRISKDHIHGYVRAPRYRQSEPAKMSNVSGSSSAAGQLQSRATSAYSGIAPVRPKLPPPQ